MQFNLKLVFFSLYFFVSPLATNSINDVEWIQNSVYFLRAFFDIYSLVFHQQQQQCKSSRVLFHGIQVPRVELKLQITTSLFLILFFLLLLSSLLSLLANISRYPIFNIAKRDLNSKCLCLNLYYDPSILASNKILNWWSINVRRGAINSNVVKSLLKWCIWKWHWTFVTINIKFETRDEAERIPRIL